MKELKAIEINPIVKTSQQLKENRRIKKKIEDVNRKIRRVKGGNKAKNRLIAKREALKLQLNDTTPKLTKGAFGGNYSKYRIDGISTKNISKFETRNRIGVNLLALNGKTPYICRKGGDYERKVNLMILEEGDKKHYVAIKLLERLLSMSNSKHKEPQHFCDNCLHGFKTRESRDKHHEYCISNESVKIEMADKDPIVAYSNGQHQFKVPFIMYADFESILVPIQGVRNNPNIPSTRGVNAHKPSGWCLHSKFAYGKVKKPMTQYTGPDCVEKFCEKIISEAKRLYTSFPEVPMLPLTKSQVKKHKKAKICHICFKDFKEKGKVKDHCHYTGEYRGAAHFGCNLRYKIPSYIPVVFHNLAGYDAHLFIRELAKHTKDIGVIAKNVEDYISFSVKVEVDKYIGKNGEEKFKEIDLRFIDSFKFMSSSLDSLVNNLAKGDHRFWGFEKFTDKQRELLIKKGIYPYEYMDSWNRFSENKLPDKNKFYSNLSMDGVKDYGHACKVWNEFGIKNMGEYHDLYLLTDTILLANVFESFRNVCMDNYRKEVEINDVSNHISNSSLLTLWLFPSDRNFTVLVFHQIFGQFSSPKDIVAKENYKCGGFSPAQVEV